MKMNPKVETTSNSMMTLKSQFYGPSLFDPGHSCFYSLLKISHQTIGVVSLVHNLVNPLETETDYK